jgi:hypothetical protein
LRPFAYYLYQDLAPTKRVQLGLPKRLFRNEQYPKHENEVIISKFLTNRKSVKVYEWIYTICPPFRRSCFVITIIWSIGPLFEFPGQYDCHL